MKYSVLFLAFLLVGLTPALAAKKGIQLDLPFNIAHRGFSGLYPEHTAESYKAAIANGADFIECDVVATKEGTLICFHDAYIDDSTTDISKHPEFASRKVTRFFEGSNLNSFWVSDFTLAELRTLCIKQRFNTERPTRFDCKFRIPTFEEYIQIALNASRVVGIYPEIKSPVYNNKNVNFKGLKTFEDTIVATLKKYGYSGQYKSKNWLKQPLFVQSFAPSSLIKTAQLMDAPLVFLVDEFSALTQDTLEDWYKITSTAYLRSLKARCKGMLAGLGPWKDNILVPNAINRFSRTVNVTFPKSGTFTLANPNDLVARAHALGLQVHPYTFRNENRRLKEEYRTDPWNEYVTWNRNLNIRVDGFFTDFCPTYANVRKYWKPFFKGPAQ